MKKLTKFNKIIFALALTFLLLGCNNSVDMIAFNGNIYTLDNDFSKASAFAIKDGKFYEVGNEEILQKYNTKNILDLKGSTVLPGLIDAHCHFYGLGLNQRVVDLTGTNSFNEIFYLSHVTCHLSSLTCHMSFVKSHMSRVMYHMSSVTCHLHCQTV